jgi:hypothetical protein
LPAIRPRPLAFKSDVSQTWDMSTDALERQVTWTEVQKEPSRIAEMVDSGDVWVTRRGGATPFVLTLSTRAQGARHVASTAARALRNVLRQSDATIVIEVLRDDFPWLDLIPEEHLTAFALEFTRAIEIAVELGRWEVMDQVLQEWRATAAIYADPALSSRLRGPFDEDHGLLPPEGSE